MSRIQRRIAAASVALTLVAPAFSGEGKMQLKSPAFEEGKVIPEQYTCDGTDQSPPLAWSDVPKGTKSLALIVDDPDAPGGTWVHWVLYNIPPETTSLRSGLTGEGQLPTGARQGKNDFHKIGYGGPCPPNGTHRYDFKLFALDKPLALSDNAAKPHVEAAMSGHVLAEARLTGKYSRR
jgi:Raf kinase inhibitor-like YbhB/YbcL family protein